MDRPHFFLHGLAMFVQKGQQMGRHDFAKGILTEKQTVQKVSGRIFNTLQHEKGQKNKQDNEMMKEKEKALAKLYQLLELSS